MERNGLVAPTHRIGLALVMAGLSLLVVRAALVVDLLPTSDGPQHIFSTYAAIHLDDAGRGYSRYLETGTPITSLGFDGLYRALLVAFDWRLAHQLAIAVMALVWAWGTVALASALGRTWLGLLGFVAAYQWVLYMGFYSFFFSAGVGLFLLAGACSDRPLSQRRRVLLAVGLFCQALLHVFPALLTATVLAIVLFLRAQPGRRTVEVARIATMTAPASVLLLLSFHGTTQAFPGPAASLGERLLLLGQAFVGGPLWRAFSLPLLAACGLLTTLVRWRAGATTAGGPSLSSVEKGLALAGAVLVGLAVALPLSLPTWQFFCVRFSPIGISVLALLLPVERLQRRSLAWTARMSLLVLACTALAWSSWFHVLLRRWAADALSGLDAPIRRSGARLDLTLGKGLPRPWFPFMAPLRALGPLYATAQGGTPSRMFVGAADKHILQYRRQPGGPILDIPPLEDVLALQHVADRSRRLRQLDDFLSYAPGYEDVLLYGEAADVQALTQRGFQVDFSQGALAIARFRACPVDVELVEHGPTRAAVFIDMAWRRHGHIRALPSLPASAPDGRSRRLHIPDSPCGPFWLRLVFDGSGDGRPSLGDAVCAEASAEAFVRVEASDAPRVVKCTATEAPGAAPAPARPALLETPESIQEIRRK
jgi:hypothetical protein